MKTSVELNFETCRNVSGAGGDFIVNSNMRKLSAVAFLPLILASNFAQADELLRDYLDIDKGCYPVSYNEKDDTIEVVCRGQNGWVPEGAQYFSAITTSSRYFGPKNYPGDFGNMLPSLKDDLGNGVGLAPFFESYFKELNKKGIPNRQR